MKLTEEEKEKIIQELVKAGAKRIENPGPKREGSFGKKGLPVLEIRI